MRIPVVVTEKLIVMSPNALLVRIRKRSRTRIPFQGSIGLGRRNVDPSCRLSGPVMLWTVEDETTDEH